MMAGDDGDGVDRTISTHTHASEKSARTPMHGRALVAVRWQFRAHKMNDFCQVEMVFCRTQAQNIVYVLVGACNGSPNPCVFLSETLKRTQ